MAPRLTRWRRCATSSAPSKRVSIQGTDIDKRMVAALGSACSAMTTRGARPPNLLKLGFERIDGGWRAKLELRKMTRFDVGDLLQMQPRPGVLRPHPLPQHGHLLLRADP